MSEEHEIAEPQELAAWCLRAAEPSEPAGPHLDENTFALLAEGALSEEERTEMLQHLTYCPECREAAQIALAEAEPDAEAAAVQPATTPLHKRPALWAAAALLAATVIGLALFAQRPSPTEQALARGETMLAEERWSEASEQFQLVLREPALSEEELARAKTGCRRALEQQAIAALREKEFQRVAQLRLEAQALHVDSAELANLHSEAVRQIPEPLALAYVGRLDDFGLALQGRVKSIPEEDPVTLKAREILEAALREHGENPGLQLSLARGRVNTDPERASGLFQQLLAENDNDTEAAAGLGLSQFLNGEHAAAAETFGKLVAKTPSDFNARVNFAFALEESGRTAEALEQWRLVADSHPDSDVRVKVARRIAALPGG